MSVDTKTRILDTAERLFSARGLSATSLRRIIAEANVNLAAIHYHFKSKDALIEAVIDRRVVPANQERLEMLDRAEAAAGGKPLSVESILDAFIVPVAMVAMHPQRGGPEFVRLIGRLMVEGGDRVPQLMQKHFGEVIQRFIKALARALPGLPPEELYWRFHFMTSSVAHVLRPRPEIRALSGGLSDASDYRGIADRLVKFLAAGFRAEHLS